MPSRRRQPAAAAGALRPRAPAGTGGRRCERERRCSAPSSRCGRAWSPRTSWRASATPAALLQRQHAAPTSRRRSGCWNRSTAEPGGAVSLPRALRDLDQLREGLAGAAGDPAGDRAPPSAPRSERPRRPARGCGRILLARAARRRAPSRTAPAILAVTAVIARARPSDAQGSRLQIALPRTTADAGREPYRQVAAQQGGEADAGRRSGGRRGARAARRARRAGSRRRRASRPARPARGPAAEPAARSPAQARARRRASPAARVETAVRAPSL